MNHLKNFCKSLHEIILDSLPWTSMSWKDIFEEIKIKLSFLLYPFLFIYCFLKVIIVCTFKLEKGIDWKWFLENTKE